MQDPTIHKAKRMQSAKPVEIVRSKGTCGQGENIPVAKRTRLNGLQACSSSPVKTKFVFMGEDNLRDMFISTTVEGKNSPKNLCLNKSL